jgi:hypothetical protein
MNINIERILHKAEEINCIIVENTKNSPFALVPSTFQKWMIPEKKDNYYFQRRFQLSSTLQCHLNILVQFCGAVQKSIG